MLQLGKLKRIKVNCSVDTLERLLIGGKMTNIEQPYQKLLNTEVDDFWKLEPDFARILWQMPNKPLCAIAYLTIVNWSAMSRNRSVVGPGIGSTKGDTSLRLYQQYPVVAISGVVISLAPCFAASSTIAHKFVMFSSFR